MVKTQPWSTSSVSPQNYPPPHPNLVISLKNISLIKHNHTNTILSSLCVVYFTSGLEICICLHLFYCTQKLVFLREVFAFHLKTHWQTLPVLNIQCLGFWEIPFDTGLHRCCIPTWILQNSIDLQWSDWEKITLNESHLTNVILPVVNYHQTSRYQ